MCAVDSTLNKMKEKLLIKWKNLNVCLNVHYCINSRDGCGLRTCGDGEDAVVDLFCCMLWIVP